MICGIDPGYRTGAVAFVDDNFQEVNDLPVYDKGGVDVIALMDILTSVERLDHVYIEKVGPMPKQGVTSVWNFSRGVAQIETTVALSRTPYSLVTPNTWKRAMNLPRDKDAARRMAQQWFPTLASGLKRKKDEHRAEALLIALYGRGRT
jgi:crossover junction endodeoxyribonuclease RuvC